MTNPDIAALFSLAGQTALVTGAGNERGLGFAIATMLAKAGAQVIVNDVSAELAGAAVQAIVAAGGKAVACPFDVTDEPAAMAAIDGIGAQVGHIDILVNNAGISLRRPFEDYDTETWDKVIAVNLTACFVLSRKIGGLMRAKGSGRIVSIASILGALARPTVPAYVASKTAVIGLTRALAIELGPHGVNANAVAPGFIVTDMNQLFLSDPEREASVRNRTPMGRWGKPEEVAAAVLYLASPAASFVNGHTLFVDGGLTGKL